MSTFKFFAKSKNGKANKPLWTSRRQWWCNPYQLTRLNFSCGSLWTCMCTHWSQCHCEKQPLYEVLLPFSILLTMKSAQVQHREITVPFQIHLLLAGRSGQQFCLWQSDQHPPALLCVFCVWKLLPWHSTISTLLDSTEVQWLSLLYMEVTKQALPTFRVTHPGQVTPILAFPRSNRHLLTELQLLCL